MPASVYLINISCARMQLPATPGNSWMKSHKTSGDAPPGV